MNKRAFSIVFFTIFLDMLGYGLIVPILSVYVKEIGASNIVVGFLPAIFAITSFFFTPFLGSLSDKFGRRPIILFGILVNILGYILFSQAFALPILILSRILDGIGSSNISASQAYVADITTPENRTKYMGIVGAAFGLGFIFGPAVGGLIKAYYGFSAVGYTATLLCIVNFVFAYFLLPESLKNKNKESKVNFFPYSDFKIAFKTPLIVLFFLLMFVFVFTFSLAQTIIAVLWKEGFNQNDNNIGYLFTFIGIFSVLVQGVLVPKILKVLGEEKMLLNGIILLSIGYVAVPFVTHEYFFASTLLVIALIAIGSGFFNPSLTAMISNSVDGQTQGKVLGLNQAVGSIARIFGPIASGILYDVNHSTPFISAAIFMGVSLILALSAIKRFDALNSNLQIDRLGNEIVA